MKVKIWKHNECIHIPKKEDWKEILPDDSACLEYWETYKENSVYHPYDDCYSSLLYAKEYNLIIYYPEEVLIDKLKNIIQKSLKYLVKKFILIFKKE